MFDSPLCHRSVTQFPLFFEQWQEFAWFEPLVVVALILLGIAIFWLFRRWSHSRQRHRSVRLMVFAACLLTALPWLDQGFTLFLPADSGETVGAIVVLGRGTELSPPRISEAATLWREQRSPRIFVSGRGDAPRMISLLEAQDVPRTAIDGENCSQTTPENAIFSAAILQTQGVRRILLVTDAFHLWRSMLDFQDQGFTVIPHPSPFPASLTLLDRSALLVREYGFLVGALIDHQVHGQHPHLLETPTHVQLVQLANAYAVRPRT